MSIARLHRIESARKPQGKCGKCEKAIKKGDGYLWWSVGFRSRAKRIRCISCGAPPDSQRESNEQLAQLWDTRDAFYAAVDAAASVDDLTTACTEAASGVREVIDGWEEKKGNLEQAFQGGCPAIDDIDEKVSEAESLESELQEATFEEDAEYEDKTEAKTKGADEPDEPDEPSNMEDLRDAARAVWDDNCNL